MDLESILIEKKRISKFSKEIKKSLEDSKLDIDPQKKFKFEMSLFLSFMNPEALSESSICIPIENESDQNIDVDVLATFDDSVVVIRCLISNSSEIGNELRKLKNCKGQVANYIRKTLKNSKNKNFIFILATREIIPLKTDFVIASKAGIILIDDKTFDSYYSLAKDLKLPSKEIIFSDWLRGKEIKGLYSGANLIPATKGFFGDVECYGFLLSPYYLKKICYVHRRHIKHTLDKKGVSYQRLIKPRKIRSIQKYLNSGQFFPTSVLINFEQDIEFFPASEKKDQLERFNPNIINGWINFPKKHGSAIVIDGQHRIFGYSGLNDISLEHSLSVIAFSKLNYDTQAKLFAEINENQTPINKDVLWDLFEDILPESELKYKISVIVKKLNEESIFFKDKIFIPSISRKSKNIYPLYMNSICNSLSTKIIFKKILDYDESKYYSLIDEFFSNLLNDKDLKSDWKNLKKSFCLSNNGIEILILVLDYFYDFLLKSEIDIKNIKLQSLLEKIQEYSKIISDSIISYGLEKLRDSLKQSAMGSKRKTSKDIVIEAGKFSPIFKKISNLVYLQEIKEDWNNEFKETIYFNIEKGEYDKIFLKNTILLTISSWINSLKEGRLWAGVNNSGKIVGLDFELQDKFDNDIDKMKLFISDMIKDHIISEDYNLRDITIDVYSENPLILKIIVPKSDSGVSFVPYEKGVFPKIYVKTDGGKREIKDFKSELGEIRSTKLLQKIQIYSDNRK